jgi:peptide/nickel transport system substrate-binding protein
LTTTAPVANLPSLLADEQMISVFDADAVRSAGTDPAALIGKGIYTGPFTVTKLDENELVLDRNPRYWGASPALTGATVRFVPDGQARVLAVRNGRPTSRCTRPPRR